VLSYSCRFKNRESGEDAVQSLGRLGYVFVVFALSGCVFIRAPSAAAADGADLWLYRFEGSGPPE